MFEFKSKMKSDQNQINDLYNQITTLQDQKDEIQDICDDYENDISSQQTKIDNSEELNEKLNGQLSGAA